MMYSAANTARTVARNPEEPVNALSAYLQEEAYNETIVSSLRQDYLTKKYLDPAGLAGILELAGELRQSADREITGSFSEEDFEARQLPGAQSPAQYPMGWCAEIRDHVYEELCLNLLRPVRDPALNALYQFHLNGGLIKNVYGIVSLASGNAYFQNSIQIGSLILDCAADSGTVITKDSVQFHSVDNGIYRNIESFEQYYAVARKYWGVRLVATSDYFPFLAPFAPAIMLFQSGRVHLPVARNLFYKNILSGFRLSQDYQSSRTPVTYPLPNRWQRFFREKFKDLGYNKNKHNPAQYCEVARREWQAAFMSEDPGQSEARIEFLKALLSYGSFFESEIG